MVRTGSRARLNTDGATPLANATGTGTPGSVLATERTKLQGILDAASRLATSALDGIMLAADKAKLDAAISTNVANAIVRRDASGNFAAGTITATLAGNASTATNATNAATLSAGTDRSKLDRLGTTFVSGIGANVAYSAGGHVIHSYVVPTGLWAVHAVVSLGTASPIAYFGVISSQGPQQAAPAARMQAGNDTYFGGTSPPLVVAGGYTAQLAIWSTSGGTAYKDATNGYGLGVVTGLIGVCVG